MSRWHTTEFDFLPELAFRPRGPKGSMTLEGGKGGSSAPAPDPRLTEAQIKSMGIQDDAIQRILANAQDLAPLQKQQLEQSLKNTEDDRSWMVGQRDKLGGLLDSVVRQAREFNTEDRQAQLAAEATGDVNQAFASARGQSMRDMSRMGVNPSSGRVQAMENAMSLSQAAMLASAANKTRQAARLEGYGLTDRAVNALSGYPAQASGLGGTGLTLANSGLSGLNAGLTTAGQLSGSLGSNATGMYSAQASYKNAQDNIANEGYGALLGAGAKLGGAALGSSWFAKLAA